MQKARHHMHNACSDSLQAYGFRNYFTPLPGVLFTFPSRYWSTIGLRRVFSLGGWARRIHTGFHVPRATQDTARHTFTSHKGLSPAAAAFSNDVLLVNMSPLLQSYNPAGTGIPAVWAVPLSLAATGGITFCFLFLRVLRCFSSPGSPPATAGCQVFNLTGRPIQKSRDQGSLAPPPGLSQLAASFIAFRSLGIHRTPLRTFA